jgi:uncharacterized protein YabE (DUF348 family)
MIEKMKNSFKRYFSEGPQSKFIILLSILVLSIIILSMKKNVIINIDGKEADVISFRSDIKSILKKNDISIGPKDKIQPGLEGSVKNGDTIYIKRAVNVEVAVDGENLKLATSEESVEKFFQAEGIKLYEKDKVTPSTTENIVDGMKIQITRVDHQIVKEIKSIDFSTEVRKDDNLEKGNNKVVQEGVPGEREISINVIYENGAEVSREVISDVVKSEPVDQIVLQGTMNVLAYSRGGNPVAYTKVLTMKATAYEPNTSGSMKRAGQENVEYTATGTVAKRSSSENYSTIAVDPRVIPLGTKVYVEGYGFAIAEDTGGAIKGNKIDVFFNTYSEVYKWGVKNVEVYILR